MKLTNKALSVNTHYAGTFNPLHTDGRIFCQTNNQVIYIHSCLQLDTLNLTKIIVDFWFTYLTYPKPPTHLIFIGFPKIIFFLLPTLPQNQLLT
jgi:hypothetical protein